MIWFYGSNNWDLSSPARDETHTFCIEKQSLNQWNIREVPTLLFSVEAMNAISFLYLLSKLELKLTPSILSSLCTLLFIPFSLSLLSVFIYSLHLLAPRARILVNCHPSRAQGRVSSCTDLPSPITGCLAVVSKPHLQSRGLCMVKLMQKQISALQ